VEVGGEHEVEVINDLVRSTLRAVAKAITKGESETGHTRLTVELQDGEVRRVHYEITRGGTELVTA